MDSSLTAIHVAGWLSSHEMRLPTQLRPQGHDIIRTWAFYTILRSVALTDTRPWDTILINGMVLGEDGHKMSKSAGNIISPHEVVDIYGADAFRQWAAVGGTPGSDVMFRWKDVVSASRFLQKLWSIYRFSISHIESFNPETDHIPLESLPVIDRWMLSNLNRLIESTTESMDHFQFDETFKSIRGFTWEMVADNYIELVKSRLYGDDSEEKSAAQYTLHTVLNTLVRLLSPFVPFIAEEMYSRLSSGRVHLSKWPEVEREFIDENIEMQGELIKEIVASIRRYKSESGMALNAPLKKIEIYASLEDTTDIRGATNTEVEVISGKPDFEYVPVSVKPEMGIIGPRYRKKAGAIVKKLSQADPLEVAKEMESGKIILDVDGETIEIDSEAVSLEREVKSAGREVDVLDVNGSIVVIVK